LGTRLLSRWCLAAFIILPLLCLLNAQSLALAFFADRSAGVVAGDGAGRERALFRPVLNVTTANQTQSTTTGQPANVSEFPQMPLPPVGEPEPKSSSTNYLNIVAVAASAALVAAVLVLWVKRKKSTQPLR
jgi:hypothetical protein